jgi:protease II
MWRNHCVALGTLRRRFCPSLPPPLPQLYLRSIHQREQRKCEQYFRDSKIKIQNLEQILLKEYLATCENEKNDLHDIFGPYEYYYKRDQDSNYSNFYRRIIVNQTNKEQKANEELLVDINKLGDIYNELLKVERLKISSDHQIVALLIDLETTQRKKLLLKSLAQNLVCEVSLPPDLVICDIEVHSLAGPQERGPVSVYLTSTLDGLRPSALSLLQLSHKQFIGNFSHTRSSTQRMRLSCSASLELLVTESDPRYFLMLSRSRDQRFLLLHHLSKTDSEVSLIDLSSSQSKPQTLVSRLWGRQCFVNHVPGHFLVAARDLRPSATSPDDAELAIFRHATEDILKHGLVHSPLSETMSRMPSSAVTLWPSPGSSRGWLDDYDIFPDRIVAYGKRGAGLVFVQLINTTTGAVVREFDSESLSSLVGGHAVSHLVPGANSNYESNTFRFSVSSPLLPGNPSPPPPFRPLIASEASFEVELETGKVLRTALRLSPLLRAKGLEHQSLQVRSHDGYAVPLTVFGSSQCGRPTLLLGYGSYGVSLSLDYSPQLAVLMSRGWTIAFAHTR